MQPPLGTGLFSAGILSCILALLKRNPEYELDIIFLHGLKVDCVIGVWDWERRIKQKIKIDIDMAADIRAAAATDRLDDTVNYKAIAKRVISHAEKSEYQLIETLAENIAGILISDFKLTWCRVKVDKGGAVRGARAVGVIIERGQSSPGSPQSSALP